MSKPDQMPDPDAESSPEKEYARALFGLSARPSNPDGAEPVDLRAVPREQWGDYTWLPIQVPPDVAIYLKGMTEEMTRLEREAIEDRVCAFHGIADPWTVAFHAGTFRLQRA